MINGSKKQTLYSNNVYGACCDICKQQLLVVEQLAVSLSANSQPKDCPKSFNSSSKLKTGALDSAFSVF